MFTHLPEDVHLHWMRELARVARPSAIFCLTIELRRFIDFVHDVPLSTRQEWHRLPARYRPHLQDFYDGFDSGRLTFMPTNEGVEDTYGDAVVPLSFIEREWSPFFKIITYLDDPAKFWQAALVVRRQDG